MEGRATLLGDLKTAVFYATGTRMAVRKVACGLCTSVCVYIDPKEWAVGLTSLIHPSARRVGESA